MTLVDHGFSTFTTQQLARLAAYRGAVAAGIYSDWDGSTDAADTETLAWLRRDAAAAPPAEGYPFTAAELRRLEDCQAAVTAGYYSEDVTTPEPRGPLAATDEGA
jgi:hypothetical protein